MNSEAGDDPSIYITRESKTPESPRPIQPPQPSNIPVLQNQNDLLFNLVTSHTNPPFAARNMTAMDHELANFVDQADANSNEAAPAVETKGDDDMPLRPKQETTEIGNTEAGVFDNVNQSTNNNEQTAASDIVEASETTNPEPAPSSTVEDTATSNPFAEAEAEDDPAPDSSRTNPDPSPTEPANGEVNYQALLDKITASSAAAAAASAFNPETIATPSQQSNPASSLNTAGLPPRPPAQDQPNIHPNYVADQDIRSFHYPQAPNASLTPTQNPNNAFQQVPYPGIAPAPGASQNGLPPPPLPSFQQPPPNAQQYGVPLSEPNDASRYDDEKKWPPHVQQMYEDFLRSEEIYTKDASWDKFPVGSRLFVGNLPTEVVTKRDIFHCFFRFGKIAQISIKQAYGFVQFMDKEACTAALHGEQGAKIKDRPMHLEVSKPPKSRSGGGAGAGSGRNDRNRRSRSPERRPGSDHFNRNDRNGMARVNDGRRRDDYRPNRSPSPRGFRDRSPGRYRNRSRSPRGGRGSRYGRSPSPRRRSIDDDDGVPFPRRLPRDVPDVQLLLIDELDKPFIDYLEKAFRDRSLRVSVLYLPHVPIQALIKRQIVEGVQAVVKLDRLTRNTGRIPIQIFDRTAGASNVRFDEYDNLDANTAAELVVRAKTKEATAAAQMPPSYAPSIGAYPPSQYGAQAAALQQAVAQQPNIANLISSLDGPALQQLLGAMQQQSVGAAVPPPQAPAAPPTDIQALLGSLGRQPGATSTMSPGTAPQGFGNFQQPPTQQPAYGAYQQPPQQQTPQYGQQQFPPAEGAGDLQSVLSRLGRGR